MMKLIFDLCISNHFCDAKPLAFEHNTISNSNSIYCIELVENRLYSEIRSWTLFHAEKLLNHSIFLFFYSNKKLSIYNKNINPLNLASYIKRNLMKNNNFIIYLTIIIGSIISHRVIAEEYYNPSCSTVSYEDMKLSFTENRDNLVNSLVKACPDFLPDTEITDKIYHTMAYPTVAIPMPGNVNQDHFIQTKNIALIISGNNRNPFSSLPEVQKMICLNHLAFAYARGVSAYQFLDAKGFKEQLTNLPPHWLKVIALKSLLPQIESDKWIMWIDDDVISSDFLENKHSYIDMLIESYIEEGPDVSKTPSMLVSADPYTDINTGIVLVRNSEEGRLLLEHWWDTRVMDIQDPFICSTTEKLYLTLNLCLLNCNESCMPIGKNPKSLALHEQETLQILISYIKREGAIHANLYADSHVVKIFPQKLTYLEQDNIHHDIGINTFFIERHTPDTAKAITSTKDVWVQVPGMGKFPNKRGLYLIAWLSKVNDLYPYHHEGFLWEKHFHKIDNSTSQ